MSAIVILAGLFAAFFYGALSTLAMSWLIDKLFGDDSDEYREPLP
jgi:hypothetical protein